MSHKRQAFSHKLNNLLGIAQGNLELLLSDPNLSAKSLIRVEKAVAALQQMNELIDDVTPAHMTLSDYAAVETGFESLKSDGHFEKNKPWRILVIDDEIELLQIIQKQLEIAGHSVDCALNARQGLKMLNATGDYDLLLTDIVMSGEMNGLELASQAMRLRPDLRIVLMTGYARELENKDQLASPELSVLCQHALKKPFSCEALLLKIQRTMDS